MIKVKPLRKYREDLWLKLTDPFFSYVEDIFQAFYMYQFLTKYADLCQNNFEMALKVNSIKILWLFPQSKYNKLLEIEKEYVLEKELWLVETQELDELTRRQQERRVLIRKHNMANGKVGQNEE